MREQRVLITTLMYRRYGPAIASWMRALKYADEHLKGVRLDHYQMWGNPLHVGDDGHTIVTRKYIESQEVFRAGPWFYYVSIEDDMILPEDGLVRLYNLLAGGADIGYGLYVWRHGLPKWSAYTEVDVRTGRSISHDGCEAMRAVWGQVIDVAGVGMGCTIIKRAVLETLQFRRGGDACNDWYLSLDAQKEHYVQRCDTGLVCGHMTMEPSPRIYWPDPEYDNGYRTEFLPHD